MATFEQLVRAIEALPDDDFRVFIDDARRVSEAGVASPELAKLYATWGLLIVEASEAVWPRPKEFDVLPAWRFEYGFRVLPPAEHEDGAFLRRHGAGFIPAEDDPIEQILGEIRALEAGIAQLRKAATPPPNVLELVDTKLDDRRFTMEVLDRVAEAGPEIFRIVAPKIHALETHREWVLELLGKMKDASPEAIAKYRFAFEGDDSGEREKALAAVKAISATPASRALVPTLRACVEEWEEEERAEAIALLGFLEDDYVALVEKHLESLTGDSFGTLLRALRGLDVSKLARAFLERYRRLDPSDRTTLEAIEGLVGLGLQERATMEPIVREHFLPKGGFFQERAEALLSRWAEPR